MNTAKQNIKLLMFKFAQNTPYALPNSHIPLWLTSSLIWSSQPGTLPHLLNQPQFKTQHLVKPDHLKPVQPHSYKELQRSSLHINNFMTNNLLVIHGTHRQTVLTPLCIGYWYHNTQMMSSLSAAVHPPIQTSATSTVSH